MICPDAGAEGKLPDANKIKVYEEREDYALVLN
jgi:hypothetical protein